MSISFTRKVATAVFALALVSGSSSAFAATNRANGACTKAGAKATIAGKKYVCAKNIMKKLTWMVPAATSKTPAAKPTIKGGSGGEGNESGEGSEGREDD